MGFEVMQKIVLLDMFVCVAKGTSSMTKATLNLFVCPQRAQFVICNL
jgi:hypothetical protein